MNRPRERSNCRPEEFALLNWGDVKKDGNGELYWWIEHKNQKHTGTRRRVYLTEEMQEITKRQMERYRSGRLFRNERGTGWSPEYLNIVLREVCAKPACDALGLNNFVVLKRRVKGELQEVRKYEYVTYTARHTFAHRYLTGYYLDRAGNPIILGYAEVTEYMGNSAREVEKVYGKLARATMMLSRRLKGISLTDPGRSEKPTSDGSGAA